MQTDLISPTQIKAQQAKQPIYTALSKRYITRWRGDGRGGGRGGGGGGEEEEEEEVEGEEEEEGKRSTLP